MKFTGTDTIAAPRDRVWAFLMDANQVSACGPGVESVEIIDADHFKVKAKVSIGLLAARFAMDMTMAERQEPNLAVIGARGQAPGSAVDAVARMELSGPAEGPTVMAWSADVTLSGALAAVGARMIEGTATRMISQVFGCFRTRLEAG